MPFAPTAFTILRISLVQNGPDNQQLNAGTLIVPANMAAELVNSLANSLKQLDAQIKAQVYLHPITSTRARVRVSRKRFQESREIFILLPVA